MVRRVSGQWRSVRVLVLGDRSEVALPACRALARAGHLVGVAVSVDGSPVLASRAVTWRHFFPARTASQDAWTAAARDAIERRGYELVLACNDIDVVRLLEARLDTPTVPAIAPVHAVILDKGALARLCGEAGVDYPPTTVPASPADDASVAAGAPGGSVVKAARPAMLTGQGVVHMAGIAAARGAAGLLAAMQRYRAAGLQPVVQGYVGGQKVQAAIIRRGGLTSCRLAALVERAPAETTLRQLDSAQGLGGECVSALERVADAAGYQGLIQAEFLAAPSGACLIDLNPRLWGGLSFAELVGLRMAERAVADALGLPAPPMPEEVPGRRYHHVARELTFIARAPRTLRSVVGQWSRGDVWDVPRTTDLRPLVLHLWQQARRRRRRFMRR